MNRKIKAVFRWTLFIGLALLISNYIWKHLEEFYFLTTIHWSSLVPILILTFISLTLAALRYHLVLKEVDTKALFFNSFKQLVVARFLNRIIPQSGMVYRAQAFKKSSKLGYDDFFSGFFAFTWLDFVMTFSLTFFLIALYQPGLMVNGYLVLPILGLMVFFLIILTWGARWLLGGIEFTYSEYNHIIQKIIYVLLKCSRSTASLIQKPKLLICGGLIISANIMVSVWRLYYYFQLIGVSPKLGELSVFVALNRMLTVIVLTPGNLGLTEILFGYLSDAMDLGAAQGITAALIVRISVFCVLAFLNFVFLLFRWSTLPKNSTSQK